MSTTTVTPEADRSSSTFVNALLGAVVGIILGFIPFSTVLGGGVAGYLQGPDRRAGLRVGAYAGVIMAIPFALLVVLGLGFFTVVAVSPGGGTGFGISIGAIILGLVVVLVASVYTVGGAALGGYLGAYLKEDRQDR